MNCVSPDSDGFNCYSTLTLALLVLFSVFFVILFVYWLDYITLHDLTSLYYNRRYRALDHPFSFLLSFTISCYLCDDDIVIVSLDSFFNVVAFFFLSFSFSSLFRSFNCCARGNERTVIKPPPIASAIRLNELLTLRNIVK